MSTTDQPPRRRLAMPAVTEWPRAGKIRLGEQLAVIDKDTGKQKMRSGEAVTRPAAVDYFRVDPEDEITPAESAASFLAVYGAKPRELRCQIPGRVAADVWEGAYRLYGTRKLKIRCDGQECDERTPTGGWETKPCVCRAKSLPADSNSRCKLGWTLNVLLPEVAGVGVWQITTGSEISVNRVSRWLTMMESLVGDLLLLEFTLALVPVDVTPDGKTKEVWVLEPRATGMSPQALLEGGGRGTQPLLIEAPDPPPVPAPADDEKDDGIPEVEATPIAPRRERPDDDALWRERLSDLTDAAGSVEAVKAAADEYLGREADGWDVADDDLYTHLVGVFRKPPEGQESMLPAARREDPA